VKPPQVVATALALAPLSIPSKANLIENFPPEQRCAHGNMARDRSATVFAQVIGSQGAANRPLVDFGD
jgi:hypothetical protein